MPLDGQTAPAALHLDETGRVLLKAADLLRQHGWCRWTAVDDVGRMCAGGAIAQAANGAAMDWQGPLVARAFARLHRSTGGAAALGHPSVWNNEKAGSAEVVIAALERAAFFQDETVTS